MIDTICHPLLADYEKAYKERLNSYKVKCRQNPAYKKKEREAQLAKYHRNKQWVLCELCNTKHIYIERHRLSRGHLKKESDAIAVIGKQFKDVLDLATRHKETAESMDRLESDKNAAQSELETIKKDISSGTVPLKYIDAIKVMTKKNKYSII